MRLYVRNSTARPATAIPVDSYLVLSMSIIIFKTAEGVFAFEYSRPAMPGALNIVDAFEDSHPDLRYESITALQLRDIELLRARYARLRRS